MDNSDGNRLVDVAGHEIVEGDYVAYPQMSGRSAQTVLGQVVKIGPNSVQVKKVAGARWSPSYDLTQYFDTRDGKDRRIRWIYSEDEAWLRPPRGYYVHRETGEEISGEEYYPLPWGERTNYDYHRDPGQLQDWVEVREVYKTVNIKIRENLVWVDYSEPT